MAITRVTRRALFRKLAEGRWWGDCRDEVEFLARLYPLDEIESSDARYETFRGELIQHRVRNDDWTDIELLEDSRLRLTAADDEPLLAFLAETLHPELCDNRVIVENLLGEYNEQLRPDGWELYEAEQISGRPVYRWRPVAAPTVTQEQLRAAIAESIWANFKSYDVEEVCVDLGLEPSAGEDDDPHSSKRWYVRRRVDRRTRSELLEIADKLQQRTDDPQLKALLDAARATAPASKLAPAKQLLFASIGPKPEIVLEDAISNTLRVVKNEDSCLSYNEPVHDSGLTWRQLIRWWARDRAETDERKNGLDLHKRLLQSLNVGPEQFILQSYAKLYGELGFDIPALLPQVYLHYDPYSRSDRRSALLPRQRMDFLLLLPHRRRAVIELDGQQHYADDDGKASPRRYAEMVREDRNVKLGGYDIYRIGGYELTRQTAVEEGDLQAFFVALLRFYDVSIDG